MIALSAIIGMTTKGWFTLNHYSSMLVDGATQGGSIQHDRL